MCASLLTLVGCATTPSAPCTAALPASAPATATARLQKPDGEPTANPPPSSKPVVGSLLSYGSKQITGPIDGQVTSRIRARVNDVAILDDEVREATYQYLIQTNGLPEPERSRVQKEIFERELERIIEREVILADAFEKMKKLKPQFVEKLQQAASREFDKQVRSIKARAAEQGISVQTDEELKAVLRMQGLTLEGVRRQIERSFMAMEYMRSRIYDKIEQIGPHEIREYYQEHPGEFQVEDRVTWQDIFIDASRYPHREAARQLANDLLRRARNGEDFVKLCKEYDNGLSREHPNAEGYGQRRGEIRPSEVEAHLFQLRDGEIGPLVEMATGFHIIRVLKREYAGLRPLDDKTQAEIRKKLTSMVADREFKRIVADLKRNARIERDNEP
jgi:parvulin-like peptidyl-prolyl isomerase